jgi:hypothetical protein
MKRILLIVPMMLALCACGTPTSSGSVVSSSSSDSLVPVDPTHRTITKEQFVAFPSNASFKAGISYYTPSGSNKTLIHEGEFIMTPTEASYNQVVKTDNVESARTIDYWWLDAEGVHAYLNYMWELPSSSNKSGSGSTTIGCLASAVTSLMGVTSLRYQYGSNETYQAAPRYLVDYAGINGGVTLAYDQLSYNQYTGAYDTTYNFLRTDVFGTNEITVKASFYYTDGALVSSSYSVGAYVTEILFSNLGTAALNIPANIKTLANNTTMTA